MIFETQALAFICCAFIAFCNWGDKGKKEFAGIVALSYFFAMFMGTPDTSIVHGLSMAYSALIFLALWSVRCETYKYLCYLYPISIVNEVLMLGSKTLLGDYLFGLGDTMSVALTVVMIAFLYKDSNKLKGLRDLRHSYNGWRNSHSSHNHHNHGGGA